MSLDVQTLRNSFHNSIEIQHLAAEFGTKLSLGPKINGDTFIKSLMGVETSFGSRNIPRFEPAYAPGGLYFQRSKDLRDLYEVYGALVAMSYGPFQLMYPTAVNLGFSRDRNPLELWDGFQSGPFVVSYLNGKFKQGADTIEKLASAYNGGAFNPITLSRTQNYVKKFVSIYQQLTPK